MTITKRDIEECPVCRVFVNVAEELACNILKHYNPKLDENACKSILRMRIDGKSVGEIAKMLKVPVDVLRDVMGLSIAETEKAIKNVGKQMT